MLDKPLLQQQQHSSGEKKIARDYKQQSLKTQAGIYLLLEINILNLTKALPAF